MKKYSNFNKFLEEFKKISKKKGEISKDDWDKLVRKNKKDDDSTPSKTYILEQIRANQINLDQNLLEYIQMKPTRSASGVIPITIFTKPYKCSGNCIFCPTEKNTPKSYLPQEPGIQRALTFKYNPYEQIRGRIQALQNIGHNTSKIELIISGGTWDDYPLNYRIWYILEVFRALNNSSSKKYSPSKNYNTKESLNKLEKLKAQNQASKLKNVGISIETRPDKITLGNIKWYRVFGVTKIQIGIQTLNKEILDANQRNHSIKQTFEALNLLRLAGLKIHIHWMCNLYQSDPKKDYEDFKKLFSSKHVKPDEIKIYPCSILEKTKLYDLYKEKLYKPYSHEELVNLLIKCKKHIPRYCRINRLIRDIPSNLIIEGNKITNLRQEIQKTMKNKNLHCKCIRCREIKNEKKEILRLKKTKYETSVSYEYFLEYITNEDKIAGFLRLSIYKEKSLLCNTRAMIRELHVYGMSLGLNKKSPLSSQHIGLGTKLLLNTEKIAKKEKSENIAVIAAVGTRDYYKKRGYETKDQYGYLIKKLA